MKFLYNEIEFFGDYIEPQYKNVFHFDIGENFLPYQDLIKQTNRIFLQIYIKNEIHKHFCSWYSNKISLHKNSITILE